MKYFGFAISDTMFSNDCEYTIIRKPITEKEVKEYCNKDIIVCLNPSHRETIYVMEKKYNIYIDIPVHAPRVKLIYGDTLVVMSIHGLPRMEGRHEYTKEEIKDAAITFSIYYIREL